MNLGLYISILTQFLFTKKASFNVKLGANHYTISITDGANQAAPQGLSFVLQLVGYLVDATTELKSGMTIPFKAGSSEFSVTVTQL